MPEKTKTNKLSLLSDIQIVKQSVSTENNRVFHEEIYNRYYAKVYFKSLQILKSPEDVKDIVQDIFVKIFRNLKIFKGESKFSTWVYSITYNTCVTFLKNKKLLSNDDNTLNQIADKPDENFENEFAELKIQQLNKMLSKLKEEERLVLLMHYYDEFSIKEISSFVQMNESAVKMRLKRTRDKLKQMLHRAINKN